MALRSLTLLSRRRLHGNRVLQLCVLFALWLTGEAISRALDLPVPGAVIGMALALLLLASGRMSLSSVRGGARFLLADMLLFFIPAVLAILDHREFVGLLGLKILAVILAGTIVVMATTAIAVDIGFRLMAARGGQHAGEC